MQEDKDFKKALKDKRVPILILDQKWHRIFALSGKTQEVQKLETDLTKLLEKQGQLNNDLKDMKKLKAKLMQSIVDNMEGTHAEKFGEIESRKLQENHRLIDELNEKIQNSEDELLDLPPLIKEKNEELMLESMSFCYDKLRMNTEEAEEISEWIIQVRKDLKKNIIKKQNREINNRQIYTYMHDIFGAEVIDLFDLKYEDIEKKLEKKKETGKNDEKQDNGKNPEHADEAKEKEES